MNTENPGTSEGSSRPNTPSSGSQVSGSMELPDKFVAEIAAMDYEMKKLENKVKTLNAPHHGYAYIQHPPKLQGKLEEEQRLLDAKNSNLSTLESVTKQLILLQDREHSFSKSSTREKYGNTGGEGLEFAVIQNLKAIKISTDEQKFICNNIITKYSTIISSHQESLAALPWFNEKKQLSVGVEKKRIMFDVLKMRQQTYKTKLRQLERISENRQRFEVVRLSILMTEREKTSKLVSMKDATKRIVEQEIRSLEQQKSVLQEKIASRTQEMILRIMNRTNDGRTKTSAPNAAWSSNITMRGETNESTDRSIKDRLGIRKRQETEMSAKSIKDRIGISSKQRSDSLKVIEWRQPFEGGVKETASILADSFAKYPGRKAERSRPPSSGEGHTVGATEIINSNDEYTNATAGVEEDSEIRNALSVQNSLLPESEGRQGANPVFTEKPSPVTVGILCRPPRLKAILKPATSLQSKQSETSPEKAIPASLLKPPLLSETDDIPMAQNATKEDESVTLTPGDFSGGHSIEKLSTDGDLQHDNGSDGGPAPKKPRANQKMLPPRQTTGSQRQQKKSNQAHKRVSFVSNEEENLEVSDLPTADIGTSSQICNRTPTPQPTVLTMDSEETSQKNTELVGEFIKPVDGSTKIPSSSRPPASPEEDVSGKPTRDEFQHLFSPSPQPFSTPQQQAGSTPGNFDSIFGAIFNTPHTSKDNAGFQFNVQEDTQKQNNSNEGANTSSNTGQDFFSFFGTPNANEAKKSYNDNFFKLF